MAALRILQIHNRYREPGGEDTVVGREAELLRSAGHTVIDFHYENSSGSVTAAASLLAAPWNPVAAGRMRRAIEEHRPDVAHIHNTWWSLSPSIVSVLDRLAVPTVATLHNYRLMCANGQLFRDGAPCQDCVGSHPWHGVRHRCYRQSAVASTVSAATIQLNRWLQTWQRVDRLLVLTEFAKATFTAGGLPQSLLRVKRNFVDDPGRRTCSPSESNAVLFVGRLSVEKGIQQLLRAWIAADNEGLRLAVVGDGPLRREVERDLPQGVEVLGRQDASEVRRLMLTSRALVFPSIWYEGQPMVLLEALAAGLPVVAPDLGGIPETVAGTRTATLARPGDVDSWARVLGHLGSGDWVDEKGAAARRLFEERYASDIALEELRSVYAEAIAHRRESSG